MFSQLFLTFSDAAKFADIARNLVNGVGYGLNFTFWSGDILQILHDKIFSAFGIPPLMPYSIAVFFKIFGINDFAVAATSSFYFILCLVFIFFLARKIFKNNLVAFLSSLAVGFNLTLIDYALSGASESPFVFEIIAALYFVALRKRWATIISSFLLVAMYFTRPQAFIYIAGIILFYLLTRFTIKKAVAVFIVIVIISLGIDRFYLWRLTGNSFFYSVSIRALQAATQYSVAGDSVSNALRGETVLAGNNSFLMISSLFKKTFYNLYNFYKLMPDIMNPYLFALFIIGLFKWSKDKIVRSFKVAAIFMFILTFLFAALSIPFFRYIHPIVPLVYIISIETLVWVASKASSNKKTIYLISVCLVLFLGVGQTVGAIFLDPRFDAKIHNVGKPPEYVKLSWILRDNTTLNQTVVTNLDTWGSWYGHRKTVWFPIEPKQLIDSSTGRIPFEAIYLTSYKIDDENYFMSNDWRQIFNNPSDSKKWTCDGCGTIAREFKLKGIYEIKESEDYEREDAKAILLIKK